MSDGVGLRSDDVVKSLDVVVKRVEARRGFFEGTARPVLR